MEDASNVQLNSTLTESSTLQPSIFKELPEAPRRLTEMDIQNCNNDLSSRVVLKYLLKKQNSENK
jgi:hypothetical protein